MEHIMDTFSKMADENTIDFTMANSDQIYFLQRWFNQWYLKDDNIYLAELISCPTEKKIQKMSFIKGGQKIQLRNFSRLRFCLSDNFYWIFVGLYHQGLTKGLSCHNNQINLMESFQEDILSTAMSGGHAEIMKVQYFVTDKHKNPTQFFKYLKINKRTCLSRNPSIRVAAVEQIYLAHANALCKAGLAPSVLPTMKELWEKQDEKLNKNK